MAAQAAGTLFLCILVLSGAPYAIAAGGEKATVSVRAVTAISHTDDDFICATLDWWPRDKCNYGMCPWHNSSIINLDLYSPILYNAVKAFNSLRIRLGGSLQDQITYKVGKHYADCPSFRRNDDRLFGFTDGCLAMNRWDELNIFFRRTNTTVTFGLNALRGRRKSAENGSTLHVGGWDGRNARDLMRYTVSKGYRVESWELGNELCAGGVEAKVMAAQYGKDVLRLRKMVEKVYNGTGHLPKVLAPGGFYDGPWFSEMLRVSGPGVVDAVTHHIYNLGSGKDKELINKMQDPYYLDKVAQTFSDMEATVRESGPWSAAWVGESGGAYNSGGKDVSDRFANSFWYLDQLGMSAVFGTKLIEAKYLQGRPLLACSLSVGSQFWKSIQTIKEEIRLGLRFSVGNGSATQFWLDPSFEDEPPHLRFLRLFAICDDPTILVSTTALDEGWNIAFRRSFGPDEVREWTEMRKVVPLPLSQVPDSVSWSLSPSGAFSVSSAYQALCRLPVP
ncbi:Heparanase-like protein 2 [Triticum urartu]|uniref:Heparanase-like protein 2 n=1 Tax=Triticum urartu TaxID=4572 RepID=M8AS24_TRIUA|nr:Heparanase-like protein 2 [Triticum urartu]